MKKRYWIGLGLLFMIGLLVFAHEMKQPSTPAQAEQQTLVPSTSISSENKIWVITDLHYLSQSLFENGESFAHIKQTSAGKEVEHAPERMEALVWQVEQEKPDILLVSGDLTLNGEKQSAEELAGYFEQIEALGTQVYVIPGNHDISDGWARKFSGDKQEKTAQILPSDFQTIFADMGYTEAFSTDSESLSYAVQPYQNLILLMLDTNLYSEKEGVGAPTTNGELREETIDWMEPILEKAQAEGIAVLPVMHHNVLSFNRHMQDGFLLDNAAEVQELFAEKGLTMTLTGHTHIQNVTSKQVAGTTLYDATTAAFSIQQPAIGELTFTADALQYEKKTLKMEEWAEETQQTDEKLLHYDDYAERLFVQDGENMGIMRMLDEQWYDEAYADEVGQLVGELNRDFFSGTSSEYSSKEREAFKQTTAYQEIKQRSRGSLLRYVEGIIQQDGGSNLSFSIPWKQ